MPNETAPAAGGAATNGRAREESLVERATRILGGDVRPGDYLALPPEAAEKVEWEFRAIVAMRPGAMLSEAEKLRVRQDRALEYHYGGRRVAALRTPEGVIALASGEAGLTAFYRDIPNELRAGVVSEYPHPWE